MAENFYIALKKSDDSWELLQVQQQKWKGERQRERQTVKPIFNKRCAWTIFIFSRPKKVAKFGRKLTSTFDCLLQSMLCLSACLSPCLSVCQSASAASCRIPDPERSSVSEKETATAAVAAVCLALPCLASLGCPLCCSSLRQDLKSRLFA